MTNVNYPTAEDARHLAEARLADIKAEREALFLEFQRIDFETKLRDERQVASSDYRHRVYQFNSAVSATMVDDCILTLNTWSRMDPGCAMTIVFDSPGGSVVDGFALWDEIKTLQRKGHHFTTKVRGMAASMAGVLLQAGDTRLVGSESVVLVHELSFGASGKTGQVEDEMAFAKFLSKRLLSILASRSTLTEKQIDRKWKRTDWWIGADEAVELGFADGIG